MAGLFKRNGIWQAKYYMDGKPVYKSLPELSSVYWTMMAQESHSISKSRYEIEMLPVFTPLGVATSATGGRLTGAGTLFTEKLFEVAAMPVLLL